MNLHKNFQSIVIPIKIIKMNTNIFTNFVCSHFNNYIYIGKFLQKIKHANK